MNRCFRVAASGLICLLLCATLVPEAAAGRLRKTVIRSIPTGWCPIDASITDPGDDRYLRFTAESEIAHFVIIGRTTNSDNTRNRQRIDQVAVVRESVLEDNLAINSIDCYTSAPDARYFELNGSSGILFYDDFNGGPNHIWGVDSTPFDADGSGAPNSVFYIEQSSGEVPDELGPDLGALALGRATDPVDSEVYASITVGGFDIGVRYALAIWSSTENSDTDLDTALGVDIINYATPSGTELEIDGEVIACSGDVLQVTTTPDLQWNPVDDAEGYEVQVVTGSECAFNAANDQDVGNSTSASFDNALAEGDYCWRVRAYANTGAGRFGSEWTEACPFRISSCQTLSGPASQQVDGNACGSSIEIDSASTSLSWSALANASSYDVEIYEGSSCTGSPWSSIDATSTSSATISGLVPGSIYSWRARGLGDGSSACEIGDWSSCCTFSRAEEQGCVSTPANDRANDRACGGVVSVFSDRPVLAWDAVPGATGYDWELSRSCGGEAIVGGRIAGSQLSWIESPKVLQNGEYRWRVRARGDACQSDWTDCCRILIDDGSSTCGVRRSYSKIVPQVIDSPGAGGSLWRSTFDIVNGGDNPATVELAFLARGQDNSVPAGLTTVTVPPLGVRHFDNLLAEAFGTSGTQGALGIRVVGDETRLRFASRTFNEGAASCGPGLTFGSATPILGTDDALEFGESSIINHLSMSTDSSQGFRVNLFFVNPDPTQVAAKFELYDQGTFVTSGSISLLPYSVGQLNGINNGHEVVEGYAVIEVTTPGGRVHTIAGVTANGSGDPLIFTGRAADLESGICDPLETYARNPFTGECEPFASPCDIPEGWRPCGQSGSVCDQPTIHRISDPYCGVCRDFFGCSHEIPSGWQDCS